MKMHKATIRPGTVLEVLENGCIKASAPGLFSFIDKTDLMPPVMPWFIGGNANAFSQPKQYDDVWIMNFTDNPRQLYWFRKDNMSDNTNLITSKDDAPAPLTETNVEVLCNRETPNGWATIYFADNSGWVIGNGDSIIKIRPDGSILLSADSTNRCIDINGKNISIGTEGVSAHPAAYGDAVEDIMTDLCVMLNKIAVKAMTNPYTMAIGTEILSSLPGITDNISKVSSKHVTID